MHAQGRSSLHVPFGSTSLDWDGFQILNACFAEVNQDNPSKDCFGDNGGEWRLALVTKDNQGNDRLIAEDGTCVPEKDCTFTGQGGIFIQKKISEDDWRTLNPKNPGDKKWCTYWHGREDCGRNAGSEAAGTNNPPNSGPLWKKTPPGMNPGNGNSQAIFTFDETLECGTGKSFTWTVASAKGGCTLSTTVEFFCRDCFFGHCSEEEDTPF